MSRSRAVVLACALLVGTGSRRSAAQDANTVVAQINGQRLTIADLDRQEGSGLLQAQYQYFEAQRKALESLIDQRLLDMQAAHQHLTVEQLLQLEVNSKVTDPTEDQLRVYYEGVDTAQPFEAVRDKLLDHLRELRRAKIRAAYIKQLRNDAQIVISMAPPTADVEIGGSYVRGRAEAPVLMVEFSDYQCPYCQKVSPDLEKLLKEFGDKLAIAYKDFPLPIHPNAQKAAEAARCAGVQGKFWEYHDVLFRNQQLDHTDLKKQARTLNLDSVRFDKCLDSGEQAAAVKKDFDEAARLGLSGTPSFFVNRHFFSGALDYASLRDAVNQQLTVSSSAQTSPKPASLR